MKLEDVGSGEQEITSIEENEKIICELRFKKPDEMIAESYMTTTSAEGQSRDKANMGNQRK